MNTQAEDIKQADNADYRNLGRKPEIDEDILMIERKLPRHRTRTRSRNKQEQETKHRKGKLCRE